MTNKKKILDKLHKDVDDIEDKIANADEYNKRNSIIRKFLKTGIAVDYAVPFIIAGLITLYAGKTINHTPFIIDTHEENEIIEITDTSNGVHAEKAVDCDYLVSNIEYSTAWKQNEYGLYERTSTSYILYGDEDLTNKETVFSMTKEELDAIFVVTNVEIITKDTLDKEDEIYANEVIIIKNYICSSNIITAKESFEINATTTIIYLVITFFFGKGVESFKSLIFQNYIKDCLEMYEAKYKEIDEKEIKKLKQALAIKKQNLSLIEGWQKRI